MLVKDHDSNKSLPGPFIQSLELQEEEDCRIGSVYHSANRQLWNSGTVYRSANPNQGETLKRPKGNPKILFERSFPGT